MDEADFLKKYSLQLLDGCESSRIVSTISIITAGLLIIRKVISFRTVPLTPVLKKIALGVGNRYTKFDFWHRCRT